MGASPNGAFICVSRLASRFSNSASYSIDMRRNIDSGIVRDLHRPLHR